MTVVALPRQYGPKAPRHIARRVAYRRRPLAAVVAFPAPSKAGRRPEVSAYNIYLEASVVDETDNDAGIALYERALALDPKLGLAHTNLGNCHFRQGRVDLARQYFQRALEVEPEQPEALHNLGYLSLCDGDINAAIPLLERAVKADPSFADAWFNLGLAHERRLGTHRCPLVYRCFQRYLKLASNGDAEYTNMARLRLA